MKKLWILIALLFSCQSKVYYNDNLIITIDSIITEKIVKLPTRWDSPLNVQFKNDSIAIINFYPEYSTIYIININSSEIIDSIPLKNFHIKYFHYINHDSILLYAHEYSEDSIIYRLYLIDAKGRMLFKEDLTTKFINCKSIFSEKYYDKCLIDNLFYYKNNLYFSIMYSSNAVFAKLNLKSLQLQVFKNITYPNLNKNMPKDEINYYHINLFPVNNQLTISFNYTPKLYVLNMDNNNVSEKVIKSNIENENIKAKYYGPFYRINDTLYGRFILMENEKFEYPIVLLLDKELSYLGEFYFKNTGSFFWFYPTKTNFNIVSNDDKYYYFKKASFKFKKIEIKAIQQKIYKESFNNKLKEASICKLLRKDQMNEVNENQILSYIRNFLNLKDSTLAIIVLNKKGCSSCNTYIEEFLKNNRYFFSNFTMKKLYVLYVYDASDFKLPHIKDITTIADTTKTYEYIHPYNSFNPRLILVKHNKIISDTIYLPSQLDLLISRIFHFYDVKVENNY